MRHQRESSTWFYIALIAFLAFLPGAAGKDHGDKGRRGPMRFRGLDVNNDGRITRDEWRGSDHSFSVHDRNGDGVIAGSEIGAALKAQGHDDFLDIDRNRDRRISRNEWRWDRADFDRMDENHDGSLTRPEYQNVTGDAAGSVLTGDRRSSTSALKRKASLPEDRRSRFNELDLDGNNLISLDEWGDERKRFEVCDQDDDGALSRDEFLNASPEARNALFTRFDPNGNGEISRTEWKGDRQSFARLDANADGRLMRAEFIKRYDDLEQSFSGMDRDQSGRLSRLEWRGEQETFGYLDDNHDDQLSLVEFVGMN